MDRKFLKNVKCTSDGSFSCDGCGKRFSKGDVYAYVQAGGKRLRLCSRTCSPGIGGQDDRPVEEEAAEEPQQ